MAFQVTDLTKNKKCYEKEFIDFEFDGKHISEFQLVAVSDGDRYSFTHSPEFEDETSYINGVHGRYYWGTHFQIQKKVFKLATDGMTEQDLNAFKNHFRPGKYGKFVEDYLAERYGYCRVSSVTNFQFLPFKIKKQILGKTVDINLYKGSAEITFEFDDPYMYSAINYINTSNLSIDSDIKPTEINGNQILAFNEDIPMLKAIYNNGIPTEKGWSIESLKNKCHIGCGYAIGKNQLISNEEARYVRNINDNEIQSLIYYNPSNIDTPVKITLEIPTVFSNFVTKNNSKDREMINELWDGQYPLYYASIVDDINNLSLYNKNLEEAAFSQSNISMPKNSVIKFSKPFSKKWLPFLPETLPFILGNRISEIENDMEKIFKFTSPDFFYSINLAIKTAWELYEKAKKENLKITLLELQEEIIKTIKNKKVLTWAIKVLSWFKTSTHEQMNIYNSSNGILDGFVIITQLPRMFRGELIFEPADPSEAEQCNATFKLNWAAAFNVFMLYLISLNTNNIIQLDDFLVKAPEGFSSLTLIIDGIENETHANYQHRSFIKTNNNYHEQYLLESTLENVHHESCSDCVQSIYPKINGNNTFDQDSGVIETVSMIQFYRSNENSDNYFYGGGFRELLPLKYATLEYKYTYV